MKSAVIDSAKSLGAVLSTARTVAGLTQERAAALSAVPRAYVSALETGKDTMALERLFRLLQAYGAEMRVEIREAP